MAEPTWEETQPIETAPPSAEAAAPTMPAAEEVPTWESTFDPQEKYGTLGQQAIAGVEGVAKGLAGPLATGAERMLGVPAEDIQGREEANPITHYAGEALGLVGPALATAGTSLIAPEAAATVRMLGEFTQAGLLTKAGTAASKASGLGSTAGKLATQFGVENALLGIGDELSKEIEGNPNTIQTAALNVGLMGVLGGATGGAFGKASDLWKAKFGPEGEKFVKDFRGRSSDIGKGNVPAADVVLPELENEFAATRMATEDLRGSRGLKAEEIHSLLPEKTSKGMRQVGDDLLSTTDQVLRKASAEPELFHGPRFSKLSAYGDRLAGALADPSASPSQIFTAMDNFKKDVGELTQWNKVMEGAKEPADAALIKDVYHTARTSLEDPSVWGRAGKRQAAINKLFSDYIPAAKDFEKTFGEKIGNEVRISPQKVATFINQLGKANAEIKSEKLANYLKANDKLYKELDKIHSSLGVESPYERPTLTATRAVLEDLTPGMKAADFVHKHALNLSAEGISGAIGAVGGHASGIPGAEMLGAYISHHAIKPFLKTIMPVLIRPLMRGTSSALGFRAGIEALEAVVKGEALATSAAKAIFTSGREVIPQSLVASSKETEKLERRVEELSKNPTAMLNIGGETGHYLPSQSTALAQMAANAVSYLNEKRPKPSKSGALDTEIPPSIAQQKEYQRTLRIAQQPLTVLEHLKDGKLNSKDIQDLSALYPAAYSKLRGKVYGAMTDHLAQGGKIPYPLRMGLSLFLGEPLDSTLTPGSIMAAQATFAMPEAPQAQGMKKSSAKNSKLASLAETPLQSRQASKSIR